MSDVSDLIRRLALWLADVAVDAQQRAPSDSTDPLSSGVTDGDHDEEPENPDGHPD